jgi:hypothetical protein
MVPYLQIFHKNCLGETNTLAYFRNLLIISKKGFKD